MTEEKVLSCKTCGGDVYVLKRDLDEIHILIECRRCGKRERVHVRNLHAVENSSFTEKLGI